jgi:hypothetical protein
MIKFGQLLKILLNIKRYIFKLVKSFQSVQPKRIQPELACAIVDIDHQMFMIQVQVGKNFIDDVLIDGGFGVNIITDNTIKSFKTYSNVL